MISIKGIDKAALLAALYNAAKPLGWGILPYDSKPMTPAEARELLDGGQEYFDYVKGRVMKVALGSDELCPTAYNRDNGEGAAESVIAELREMKRRGL